VRVRVRVRGRVKVRVSVRVLTGPVLVLRHRGRHGLLHGAPLLRDAPDAHLGLRQRGESLVGVRVRVRVRVRV